MSSIHADRLPLKGLVVLITGAASGIGAATALEVVHKGGIPVLVDCDEEPLALMAQQCGEDTLYCVADVTHMAAMVDVVAKTLSVHHRMDVVFANAGVAAFGPVAYVDPQAWQRCVEVNIFGVFNTVRSALPPSSSGRRARGSRMPQAWAWPPPPKLAASGMQSNPRCERKPILTAPVLSTVHINAKVPLWRDNSSPIWLWNTPGT
ncbi:MAG: SDR family NAD(P)-dependent oxidoreductase, partial [Betaproteobacteria bacterium]|nr:SDR family NAD(P)-dependent oxidoreductase [Betaproteobacteria bacterium]